jgi:hypothetical protein
MRFFKVAASAVLLVGMVSVYLYAQAKAEGGRIMKDNTGTYSTYAPEQALNSMADWYTAKRADSVGCVVATKYGTTARLKQIYNNSGTLQKIKLVFVNAISTVDDTITFNLNAYSSTGKIPSVKKVVSGAVIDSTIYFIQVN